MANDSVEAGSTDAETSVPEQRPAASSPEWASVRKLVNKNWLLPGAIVGALALAAAGATAWNVFNKADAEAPVVAESVPPSAPVATPVAAPTAPAPKTTGVITERVSDVPVQPAVKWTFDYAFGDDEQYSGAIDAIPVDDDAILVAPELRWYGHSDDSDTAGFTQTVSLLDTATGSVRWTTDLSDQVDAWGDELHFTLIDVPGADFVAMTAEAWGQASDVVLTLDKATGVVIDKFEVPGDVRMGADATQGALFLTTYSGCDATVRRYDSGKITGDPVWEIEVAACRDYSGSLEFDHDVILANSSTSTKGYYAATGEPLAWNDLVGEGMFASYVGDQLIRTHDTGVGVQIMGLDGQGEEVWDDPVNTQSFVIRDGALYVTEQGWEDDERTRLLMRIDPRTGEDMWEAPFEAQGDEDFYGGFDGFGTFANSLVVATKSDSGYVTWSIDADTGEPTGMYSGLKNDGSGPRMFVGESYFYGREHWGEQLAAFKLGNSEPMWSFNDGDVIQVGKHLFVSGYDRLSISLLG